MDFKSSLSRVLSNNGWEQVNCTHDRRHFPCRLIALEGLDTLVSQGRDFPNQVVQALLIFGQVELYPLSIRVQSRPITRIRVLESGEEGLAIRGFRLFRIR
jgi:hypothetical protein